jgi:membrane associated rhomboid family serine protease
MAVPPGHSAEFNVSASAPTCFRHPNRETYVSCVRCGRPACPDCLRSAAVGQQCVECVREGNRTVRRPSALFGGKVAERPWVTWTLVALNVLVYLGEIVNSNTLVNDGEMIAKLGPTTGVADGQWYRLITSAFLHAPLGSGFGIFHILFNMYALIVVGPALERLLGRVRFLSVYLVSALGGSVLSYLIAAPTAASIGASGAIFGLFGAWLVLAKRLRLDYRQVVGLIVLNLIISFGVPGIAWQAHVGGLIAGSALTAAYAYAPRDNRTLIQLAATAGMVALLVLGVVLRDHQLAHVALGGLP